MFIHMSKHPIKQCFVYAIRDKGNDRYKIGHTDNIQRRIKQLQTGNSEPLEIIYYRRFDNCIKVETTLHQIFSAYRKRGEWFSLSRQSKEILQMIFTQTNLTEQQEQALQRLGIM